MAQPWQTIDTVLTPEGPLELRQRAAHDFLITIGGRVLMTSQAQESEVKLAQWACETIRNRLAARVLVGGLGMGYTLRATLQELASDARVVLAELNPAVVRWCQGPLAELTQHAVADPRVEVRIADVAQVVAHNDLHGAHNPGEDQEDRLSSGIARGFDAIVFDLYEGPHVGAERGDDPLYGEAALRRGLAALRPGGTFAIWGEEQDQRFEKRLDRLRVPWKKRLAGRGGRRHVVYLLSTG